MADSTTTSALTGTVILGALTLKGTDLIKYAVAYVTSRTNTSQDANTRAKARTESFNGLVTLLLGCLVGVAIVMGFAHTQLATQVKIGGLALSHLDTWGQLALGLAMTGVAGTLYDGKKAIDNTDSASKVKVSPKAEKARQEQLAGTG